jgi:predicted Zn-dependent protease
MARPGTQQLARAARLAAVLLAAPWTAGAAPLTDVAPWATARLATTGSIMAWQPQLTVLAAPSPATITQQQVVARAAEAYAGRLSALQASHALDADPRFLARVRRIAAVLIAQAALDYPETASWSWQIHTTTDPEQDADCMAGGHILVGQPYAERLALNDAELAMLLAHEIAHAALRHNLQEYELALRLEPARAALPFADLWEAVDHDQALMDKLAPLGREQESEADRAGMQLAVSAGWEQERLASYYQKLLRNSSMPGLDSDTHPSPLSRWRAARSPAAVPQH